MNEFKETNRKYLFYPMLLFVIGTLMDFCEYPCDNLPIEPNANIVTYNPYKYDSFVIKNTKEPIYNADEVDMVNLKNKLFIFEASFLSERISLLNTKSTKVFIVFNFSSGFIIFLESIT